jgi:hypothetical protein
MPQTIGGGANRFEVAQGFIIPPLPTPETISRNGNRYCKTKESA